MVGTQPVPTLHSVGLELLWRDDGYRAEGAQGKQILISGYDMRCNSLHRNRQKHIVMGVPADSGNAFRGLNHLKPGKDLSLIHI